MEQEKTMREPVRFTAHHVYLFAKVLSKVGVVKSLTEKGMAEKLAKNPKLAEQKGEELVALVLENIPNAEAEVNAFLEAVTGEKNIAQMGFEEYDELTSHVFGNEDFPGFFQSAIKLSMRILVSR